MNINRLKEVDADALARANRVTPGASQTSSRRHGAVGPSMYPAFSVGGDKAHIWLGDGGQAIDLAGANASVALGYNHPAVTAAIQEQLWLGGGSFSLPSFVEYEVSQRLVDLLPFPAKVRWVRTGSEAVSAAIAIAQHVTNRSIIGVFESGYHGWHPWTRHAIKLRDGDLAIFPSLAAVVVESPRWALVDDEYVNWLSALRHACSEAGCLLVFDDVVYAFRFHKAGLQGSTGVQPDLACFSKALGNGVPVACVAGEPDLMERASFRVSSTFGGELLGLSAANAVLALHQKEDVCGDLQRIGVELRDGLVDALANSLIRVVGTPQHFRFEAPTPAMLDGFLAACMGREHDSDRLAQKRERVLIHRDANNVNLAMDAGIRQQIVATVNFAANEADTP